MTDPSAAPTLLRSMGNGPRTLLAKQPAPKRALMASDKHSKPRFGAKSEFVRSLDPTIPAAEVVAMAEKRGLKLTTGLVYNIRSASNASLRGSRARMAQKPVAKWRNGTTDDNAEAQLRAAIAQIGLSRARQILEEVEETFAGR
ncbi:MAG: hypothetical protein ABW061_20530 [Polyangiaceae bacterium]